MKIDLGLPKRLGLSKRPGLSKYFLPKYFLPRYSVWVLLCMAASFLTIEYFMYGLVGSLSEDIPRFYGSYALRSLFFVISSAILVALFHINAVRIRSVPTARRKELNFSNTGAFEALPELRQGSARRETIQTSLLVGTLAFNFLVLALLRFEPSLFSHLGHEGILIEPLSALALFAGSAVFVWLMSKVSRRSFPNKVLIMAGLSGLALIFFVIAMEEVSWFQRVVGFETPDSFASNLQGEFNFHNFATKVFENFYYVGAFVCLVVFPFVNLTTRLFDATGWFSRLKGLRVFIASPTTLCVSALLTAYNYHYWNAFTTQIPFFLTLFILISLWKLSRERLVRQSCAVFAIALVTTQAAFFAWGHTMPRLWDATEYKEFFIAVGFFLYALDIKRSLLQHASKRAVV